MDAETQRRKRQEALDEKKKRLEEMRKSKVTRENQAAVQQPVPEPVAAAPESKAAVDDLVSSLLAVNIAPLSPAIITPAVSSNDNTTSVESASNNLPVSSSRSRQVSLSVVRGIAPVHVMPASFEFYDKECQTDFVEYSDDEADKQAVYKDKQTPQKIPHRRPATRASRSDSLSIEANQANLASEVASPLSARKAKASKPADLSEEQLAALLQSPQFAAFLDNTSRVVERALSQSTGIDILRDYRVDTSAGSKTLAKRQAISFSTTFEDDSTRYRPVMDLHFSPHHPELFLVCYGTRNLATAQAAQRRSSITAAAKYGEDDPLGLLCVWSTLSPSRPEFKFTASSPVLTARFHEDEQHLIVGGCYTGQILLWDMRAKALPVQRSSLSGRGHKHPVYSLTISTSPSDVVTVSTDGTMCHWDISRLTEPTNVVNLQPALTPVKGSGASSSSSASASSSSSSSSASGAPSVVISSVAFSTSEAASSKGYQDVYIGTGMGSLCRGHLPFQSKEPVQQISGHGGPITAMQLNPSTHRLFRGLLLTSSVDWTVKMWNFAVSSKPVFEFATSIYDYISDVQWCPANPAVFSTVASGGSVSLWNMCRSTTEPVETIDLNVTNEETGAGSRSASAASPLIGALNRSAWAKDGSAILVGNSRGSVHLVSVQEAAVKQNSADDSKLEMTLINSAEAHTPVSMTLQDLSSPVRASSAGLPRAESAVSLVSEGRDESTPQPAVEDE